jgi:hypothetical protein
MNTDESILYTDKLWHWEVQRKKGMEDTKCDIALIDV